MPKLATKALLTQTRMARLHELDKQLQELKKARDELVFEMMQRIEDKCKQEPGPYSAALLLKAGRRSPPWKTWCVQLVKQFNLFKKLGARSPEDWADLVTRQTQPSEPSRKVIVFYNGVAVTNS